MMVDLVEPKCVVTQPEKRSKYTYTGLDASGQSVVTLVPAPLYREGSGSREDADASSPRPPLPTSVYPLEAGSLATFYLC